MCSRSNVQRDFSLYIDKFDALHILACMPRAWRTIFENAQCISHRAHVLGIVDNGCIPTTIRPRSDQSRSPVGLQPESGTISTVSVTTAGARNSAEFQPQSSLIAIEIWCDFGRQRREH